MKLIHTADLHLSSPMTAHLSSEKASMRRDELKRNFLRLAEVGAETGVDAILISGDLFDEKAPSKRVCKYVLDVIRDFPSLRFFYLPGNHDGKEILQTAGEIPENLFLFDESWTTYTPLPGLTITGSTRPDAGTLAPLPKDGCNILLLHGQVMSGTGKEESDLIYPERYKGKNLDYLALGHIHSYSYQKLDARTAYCYPGCLEGRGFDECGERGYVLLEWDGRELYHSFVPFAKRTIRLIECDITGCESPLELETRVESALAGIPASDLVRLVFCGTYLPDFMPDLTVTEETLSERFFYAEVELAARPLIRKEDYENDISLKGEFVRTVLADQTLAPDEAERIILCGLRALMGEEPIL